ncbi:MAG: hypothetical protein WCO69_00615 [Candidatus Omnitrophota bacterium]
METMIVFIIGGGALAVFIGYIAKSLKKDEGCSCSSKNCSSGNPGCGNKA